MLALTLPIPKSFQRFSGGWIEIDGMGYVNMSIIN
jgi:hypothetical protein